MGKGRLEAFSDGVIAIIITVMVLEIKIPEGSSFPALIAIAHKLFIYLLSFLFVGIYWMNHHHLLHAARKISGSTLWANMSLLFWLSLFPFVAAWMGENLFQPLPTFAYGVVLLLAGLSYLLLQKSLIRTDGVDSVLAKALGDDWKGTATFILIAISLILAFAFPPGAMAIFIAITLLWFVPDRRIEKALREAEGRE